MVKAVVRKKAAYGKAFYDGNETRRIGRQLLEIKQ